MNTYNSIHGVDGVTAHTTDLSDGDVALIIKFSDGTDKHELTVFGLAGRQATALAKEIDKIHQRISKEPF